MDKDVSSRQSFVLFRMVGMSHGGEEEGGGGEFSVLFLRILLGENPHRWSYLLDSYSCEHEVSFSPSLT